MVSGSSIKGWRGGDKRIAQFFDDLGRLRWQVQDGRIL